MTSLVILYTTAALMAVVALACTVLCLAWSIPAWRRRLARSRVMAAGQGAEAGGLTGWRSSVANGVVSIGIGACAVVGWYGCLSVLTALNAARR